jgi:hypothetical protein
MAAPPCLVLEGGVVERPCNPGRVSGSAGILSRHGVSHGRGAQRRNRSGCESACRVCYYAALALTTGIGYTPHLWMGVIAFAGIIGWLTSYLVLAPRLEPSA